MKYITAEPGVTYNFSVYYKSAGISADAEIDLKVQWKNSSYQLLDAQYDVDSENGVVNDNSWRQLNVSAQCPDGASYIFLTLRCDKATSGSVWFDDVYVAK